MDFGKRAARTFRQTKNRKEVIREKLQVTQTIVERLESNMLKCYGHVAGMENKMAYVNNDTSHRKEHDEVDP
jgi:hypothetical protein